MLHEEPHPTHHPRTYLTKERPTPFPYTAVLFPFCSMFFVPMSLCQPTTHNTQHNAQPTTQHSTCYARCHTLSNSSAETPQSHFTEIRRFADRIQRKQLFSSPLVSNLVVVLVLTVTLVSHSHLLSVPANKREKFLERCELFVF